MDKIGLEQAEILVELIYSVVKSPYNTDREAMEEIVRILEFHGMECGERGKKTPGYYILTE